MKAKDITTKTHHRSIQLDVSGVQTETRQVSASLSSEAPAQRLYGEEILLHRSANVDMSRAANGLPLLFGHDQQSAPIGRVDNIRLDAGTRKLRGTLTFDDDDESSRYWSKVQSGSLRDVSLGYRILEFDETKTGLTATRWMPAEVSLVSVPEDGSVGIGRAMNMDTKDTETRSADEAVYPMSEATFRAREDERCAELREMFGKYMTRSEARDLYDFARDNGMQPREAGRKLLDLIGGQNVQPIQTANTHIATEIHNGMVTDEKRSFSLFNAIRGVIDPKFDAGFEMEVSRNIAKETGQGLPPSGFLLPLGAVMPVQRAGGGLQKRIFDSTAAAAMIGTQHRPDLWIDVFRAKSVTMQMGITEVQGVARQNISIPRKTAPAAVGWYDLDGVSAIADADMTADAVVMSPSQLAGLSIISWRTLIQSLPEAEQTVMQDFAQSLAEELDRVVLDGSGTPPEPPGVNALAGTTDTGLAPDYQAYLALPAALAGTSADVGTLGYVLHPTEAFRLMGTEKDANTGQYIISANGTGPHDLGGYQVMWTTSQADSPIVSTYGNWAEVLLGIWGSVSIEVSNSAGDNFSKGNVSVRAILDADVSVRHAESFATHTIV